MTAPIDGYDPALVLAQLANSPGSGSLLAGCAEANVLTSELVEAVAVFLTLDPAERAARSFVAAPGIVVPPWLHLTCSASAVACTVGKNLCRFRIEPRVNSAGHVTWRLLDDSGSALNWEWNDSPIRALHQGLIRFGMLEKLWTDDQYETVRAPLTES